MQDPGPSEADLNALLPQLSLFLAPGPGNEAEQVSADRKAEQDPQEQFLVRFDPEPGCEAFHQGREACVRLHQQRHRKDKQPDRRARGQRR